MREFQYSKPIFNKFASICDKSFQKLKKREASSSLLLASKSYMAEK